MRKTNKMLKVAAIQADLAWEAPEKNRNYFEKQFQGLASQDFDLVILPEMFTTGFSMQPKKLAEPNNGITVKWMQANALKYNFLLTGSLIIRGNSNYYNRQIFAFPDGSLKHYDKRHLFRMGDEHKHYTAGKERIIINYKGWRILPQICYDLRFPIWSRNHNSYDLLIYVANFPAPRRKVWKTLLAARAIENQCYVVGCNRIGRDGYGLHYSGDTQIISPKGKVIASAPKNIAYVLTTDLDIKEIQHFRERFPVHLDADNFTTLKLLL